MTHRSGTEILETSSKVQILGDCQLSILGGIPAIVYPTLIECFLNSYGPRKGSIGLRYLYYRILKSSQHHNQSYTSKVE